MRKYCLIVFLLLLIHSARADERKPMQNPFFAMDTAFIRDETKLSIQLNLVKELGFDGVSVNEAPVDQLTVELSRIDEAHFKLFAVYYGGKVTPEGGLTVAPDLFEAMRLLKNRSTIIWLHLGGPGPAFDSLAKDRPLVIQLRKLADEASQNGLKVAIYPHIGEWTAHFADALKLARAVDHPALGVTFNLCHVLATGDEMHIPDLIDQARSSLFCVTLNGADSAISGGQWDKLIQPLGRGTFDAHIVLDALAKNHFAGPIGFQGYGIKGDARSILEPTMTAWKKLAGR
jgi:sugar phosphate isomerase/epimerase